MARWMTSEPVRSALHVMDSPAKQWPMIDEGFDYTSQYAACNPDAAPGTPSMIDFYREIAPKLSVTVVGPLAAFPLAPSPSPPPAPSPSPSPRRTHSILEEHILSRRTHSIRGKNSFQGNKFYSKEHILSRRTHSRTMLRRPAPPANERRLHCPGPPHDWRVHSAHAVEHTRQYSIAGVQWRYRPMRVV